MATALDLITRAFRKLGLASRGEPLEADDAADGLTALNAMLHAWKLRGVDLTHADLTLSGTFALAPAYEEAVVYCLAARLAEDYEVAIRFDADDHFRTVQAAYFVVAPVTIPSPLTAMPSDRRYDVSS